MNKTDEFIVNGKDGKAFFIKRNQSLRITDIAGNQVVDFVAFAEPDFKEYLSVSHSRLMHKSFQFKINDCLVSNMDNPMIIIENDTFGIHDTTYPACNRAEYIRYNRNDKHPSCQQNFTNCLEPFGIEEWRLPDPWNLFQNTPTMDTVSNGSDKLEHSKPGDYIQLKFVKDCIVAISVCPFIYEGFNGGKSTPIKITIYN